MGAAQAGVPHTLIPDVAAGSLMRAGEVDVVLVGADRIAANGDTANKVGTYPLAVLAARHDIPFYVCAPLSSVDLDTADGDAIPIEAGSRGGPRGPRRAHRPGRDGRAQPAFDVTPAELITGVVTEEGLLTRRSSPPSGPPPSGRASAGRRVHPATPPGGSRLMATVALGRRGSVVARTTTDRELLRSFLERDRLYAAYALCDLEDREFGRTKWGIALDGDDVVALVLEYSGMTPQPVFLMGEADGLEAILREVIRPRVAYLAARPDLLPTAEHFYRVEAGPPMVRMWVDRTTFRPYPATVQRLLPSEIGDLNRLYQLGFAAWLPSSAIAEGVYYGVRVNGTLVAAAGTHVISDRARLAAVGNVLTHVDYRGRGFATAVTGAVTAELLRTCDHVVLNVRSDNPPALNAYRRLGFAEYTRFEERLIRLGSPWPDLASRMRRFFARKENPTS